MSDWRGYSHPKYALSLKEFGEPRELPQSEGWILERPIPHTSYKDAMGCYPLFTCRDWRKLGEDLERVGDGLVSLSLVADPFFDSQIDNLVRCFDLVRPFKNHYVAELVCPLENFVRKEHLRKALKSLKAMQVEICRQPLPYLDDWVGLYDHLIGRHHIQGISAFSPKCFRTQLEIPGMIMLLARHHEDIIGALLVLIQGNTAYSHLLAFTPEGYRLRASYGLTWMALDYCIKLGLRYFDLGGSAGIKEDPEDGLAYFKKGWSNDRRPVYFCGRVFDQQKYESVCRQFNLDRTDYFPAYRVGEFNRKAINGRV